MDRSASVTPNTGKKLNSMIVAVMALAIVYLLYDKFLASAPETDPGVTADNTEQTIEQAVEQNAEQEQLALGI